MDFKSTVKQVISILEKYQLLKSDIKEDELQRNIDDLANIEQHDFVDPLNLVGEVTELNNFYLSSYDDCNCYQENDYYKNVLEEINNNSNGKLNFSEIDESWSDNGIVNLTFSLNGEKNTLKLDIFEQHDMVPSEFVEFIHKRILDTDKEERFISVDDEMGSSYYLLPAKAAIELSQLKKDYIQQRYKK